MIRLGQHFLINKDKLRKIVETLDLQSGDTVIEIGPGHGELTAELRIKNKEVRIIAIEKDEKLANFLKEKFGEDRNIEIIEGDVLKILSKFVANYHLPITNCKIVGNIPYYITGYLFRIIGEFENKPSLMVFTVQKEVAERVCAGPGQMNLLAASIQFWAEPEIIDFISKKHFKPQPKVDSATIRLKIYDLRLKTAEKKKYFDFIRILFKQPRKTILNNLAMTMTMTMTKEEIIKKLAKLNINPGDRPQNLTIEQLRQLSALF